MSFYMRILNRTEKNRRFLFLAAVFAVCTAAMLTVLMMPQKQVVCKGEADFKQFALILQQTIRPKNEKYLGKMMEIMDQLLREVPVYRMQCDISEEAVKMSYEAMKG